MAIWPKRWRYRILVILAGLLAVVIVADQVCVATGRQFKVAIDTTRITSPLSPEGYPDYLAAINTAHGAGVTPENNAAILIWEAANIDDIMPRQMKAIYSIWGVPMSQGKFRLKMYKKWAAAQGIETESKDEAQSFDGFSIPSSEDPLDFELEQARAKPWTAREHPLLARWVAAMEPGLAKLEEGCARPRYYVPMVTDDGRWAAAAEGALLFAMLPNLGALRESANLLVIRAMMRLETGDTTGYSRDILACLRLAHLLAQQSTLIENLVAEAIESTATKAVQTGAVSDHLDATSADALRKAIDGLGPLPSMAHAINENERFGVLDMICAVHNGKKLAGETGSYQSLTAILPINYTLAMHKTNDVYDRIVKAMSLEPTPLFRDRRTQLENVNAMIDAMKSREIASRILHPEELFLLIFVADFKYMNDIFTNTLQEYDLALAALALRAAHASGAPYPETLAGLANFIPPADRFTGDPLIYRRTGKGYVLYSLGANLKDDGGIRSKKRSSGDIVVSGE